MKVIKYKNYVLPFDNIKYMEYQYDEYHCNIDKCIVYFTDDTNICIDVNDDEDLMDYVEDI